MELKLTGPKKLVLQSNEVAYILDCLASRPYKDVKVMIEGIFFQLRQQEDSVNEKATPSPGPAADSVGMSNSGPAD